ncbi:MAG: hypothetical protein WDO73_15605 [Ignavibacteriota bacterium]
MSGGIEGRLEVKQTAVAIGIVHEEGRPRIAALHRKVEDIVGRHRVGGLDTDFAFIASVGHVERIEFHGGAADLGDIHRLAFDSAAVERQRRRVGGLPSAETGDGGQHAGLLVIEHAPRRHPRFRRR